MRFEGTSSYVATDDLKVAVNAAVTLRRPLLVKGEPGTGKTVLAHEIAAALGAPLIEWHVKSTTKAHQGLYEYDAVARLRDGQLGDARVHDIANYIRKGQALGGVQSPVLPVLLIDEIDKADIEFPNDLLQELDRMEFHVYETKRDDQGARAADRRDHLQQREGAARRLPAPLLLPLHPLPGPETMQAIIDVHFPGIQKLLVAKAMRHLLPGPRRCPASRRSPRPVSCSTG
jgi:DNA polymerase III delta prime subunit